MGACNTNTYTTITFFLLVCALSWQCLYAGALGYPVSISPSPSSPQPFSPSWWHDKRQSDTITYQVHSYNDLREWPQILRKGAQYFKIDPHYMMSNFCLSQPQTPAATQDMGCFVLSHDTPVASREYNSTYSVLSFISDPQYAMYYQNPTRTIYIALCFKLDNASPCDGSSTAQNWTALLDDFYNTATLLVSGKGLNVEFILDGSSTPTDSNLCLINKWRPWVATWIPGDSEAAPYSNNATLGLDRFQVFNPYQFPGIPGYLIDVWEIQDYGKFSKGNYSYLIWEPSDQKPIVDICDSYLHGPVHELGFRFAINIDPVQLQVFSGSRSGNAWNYNIVEESYASSPSIAVLTTTTTTSPSSFYILTSYYDTKHSQALYTVSTAPSWNSTFLGPVTLTTPTAFPSATTPVTSISSLGPNTLLASHPNGNFTIYQFNETTQLLTWSFDAFLLPCTDCDTTALRLGEMAYAVQVISGSPSCALLLQIWNITSAPTLQPSLSTSFCIQNEFQPTSYSVTFSGSTQGQSFCVAGELPGVAVFSSGLKVYASVLCLSMETGNITANGGYDNKDNDSNGVVQVDLGNSVSVSMLQFNGSLMVMEVHSDGFCWNSEPNNKQPTPATCSNTPISIDYVLVYNFGSFDDWAAHIMNIIYNKNTSYNLDSIFNSCHPTILHGAYDSGSTPNVALFSAHDDSNEVLMHAEVHEGLPSKYSNASQCGFAEPMDGIVLDSWLINQWLL